VFPSPFLVFPSVARTLFYVNRGSIKIPAHSFPAAPRQALGINLDAGVLFSLGSYLPPLSGTDPLEVCHP